MLIRGPADRCGTARPARRRSRHRAPASPRRAWDAAGARPRTGGWGAIEVTKQGVEPEPLLVVGGRHLLLGVGSDQGGVEVDHDRLRRSSQLPGMLSARPPSLLTRLLSSLD